jgi:hypothetical protein
MPEQNILLRHFVLFIKIIDRQTNSTYILIGAFYLNDRFMDKFEIVRLVGTNGANYDVRNEDIIARLRDWDEKYDLTISTVEEDTVVIHLAILPDDLEAFAHEVYEFCPDTVDQNFGCYAELIEAAEMTGEVLPSGVRSLVQGVDLSAEDYGLELLKRSIERDKIICLWWD